MPRKKLPTIVIRSRGLGDTVLKITTAAGIARAMKIISEAFDIDCGCAERQRKLNELIPYTTDSKKETGE